MGQFVDIKGRRYGRLVALYPTDKRAKSGAVVWAFRCDCGMVKEISSGSVKSGMTKSCGCLEKPHGMSQTRLYNIWVNMRQRCKNDGKPEHDNWGNRGISICDEWNDFLKFQSWALANGYQDTLTIDRVNNNKGYSPDNCRWASYKDQALNTRANRYIVINGESKTVRQWCEILKNVSPRTVYRRVREYGWTYEKAITTPAIKGRTWRA